MYIMYLGLTTTTSRAEKAEREARKMWAAIKSKLQSTTPLSNYRKLQPVHGGTQVIPLTLSARASLENQLLFFSLPLFLVAQELYP